MKTKKSGETERGISAEVRPGTWFPDEPCIVVSHSGATDEMATVMKSTCLSNSRFEFVESAHDDWQRIQQAFGKVLAIGNDGEDGKDSERGKQRRWRPVVIQLCAAAGMKDFVETIRVSNMAVRREFTRSMLGGIHALVAYVGPHEGLLPNRRIVDALSTFEEIFDLVILVSDSDGRGRRYAWPQIRSLITEFLVCLVGSGGAREFLFNVAKRSDPTNRMITFGSAALDVSRYATRSIAYSHFTQKLFECFYSPADAGDLSEVNLNEPGFFDLQYRISGTLEPVSGSLSLVERKLTADWSAVRARELAETTENLLTSQAGRKSSGLISRLTSAAAAIGRRLTRRRPQPTACSASQRINDRKAKAFQQLLRMKQIELRLQPVSNSPWKNADPLRQRLGDVGFGRDALLARLPEPSQIAWRIAQLVSLDDLTSGTVTPDAFAEKVDGLWRAHHIDDIVDAFLASAELDNHLETLASRVSPLFPTAGESPAKLLLVPASCARVVRLAGHETAVGLDGQYVLLVADDDVDLECLRSEGDIDGD